MKQRIIEFLSVLVFAIGCAVVWVYTRIRDLFGDTQMAKKVGDHFPVQREYPVQFPMAELTNVINFFRGDESVDMACAAICGWNVQGFAQSVLLPHAHEMQASGEDVRSLTDTDLTNKLDECCAAAEDHKGETFAADVGIPPWLAPFLPIMLEVARRLLDRWLNRLVPPNIP